MVKRYSGRTCLLLTTLAIVAILIEEVARKRRDGDELSIPIRFDDIRSMRISLRGECPGLPPLPLFSVPRQYQDDIINCFVGSTRCWNRKTWSEFSDDVFLRGRVQIEYKDQSSSSI